MAAGDARDEQHEGIAVASDDHVDGLAGRVTVAAAVDCSVDRSVRVPARLRQAVQQREVGGALGGRAVFDATNPEPGGTCSSVQAGPGPRWSPRR